MDHLMQTLEHGHTIGNYGRLVFAIVGRHFLEKHEVEQWIAKDSECDEERARALVSQVDARGYNPPKRERILEWMGKQNFPVCPNPDDPAQCNVYRNLEFPQEVYEKIAEFHARRND